MENKLDVNSVLKADNNNPVKIGELTPEVIEKLKLKYTPRNIIITADRIYHCENHQSQYINNTSYEKSMSSIPEIIKSPDYIGFNENNNSLLYVKELDDATLVAVRLHNKGVLRIRTVFPLTKFDLEKKIKFEKIIPFK